jgi:hypothetical protein
MTSRTGYSKRISRGLVQWLKWQSTCLASVEAQSSNSSATKKKKKKKKTRISINSGVDYP